MKKSDPTNPSYSYLLAAGLAGLGGYEVWNVWKSFRPTKTEKIIFGIKKALAKAILNKNIRVTRLYGIQMSPKRYFTGERAIIDAYRGKAFESSFDKRVEAIKKRLKSIKGGLPMKIADLIIKEASTKVNSPRKEQPPVEKLIEKAMTKLPEESFPIQTPPGYNIQPPVPDFSREPSIPEKIINAAGKHPKEIGIIAGAGAGGAIAAAVSKSLANKAKEEASRNVIKSIVKKIFLKKAENYKAASFSWMMENYTIRRQLARAAQESEAKAAKGIIRKIVRKVV